MKFLKRLVLVLTTGYILMYFSEFIFWSRYKQENTLSDLIITWIIYSVLAFIFLLIIKKFNVRNVWALFLAGALFGWLNEGVIVQTMYDSFPLNISWTGLAWHALISVLIGFYFIRKTLLQNRYIKTLLVSVLFGTFWGIWSISWWLVDDFATSLCQFSLYSFSITFLVVLGYYIYDKSDPLEFKPTILEMLIVAGIMLYFAFVSIQVNPISLIILPLLLAVTYAGLRKNKESEKKNNILEIRTDIKPLNYLFLLFMPISAILFYAISLSLNLRIPTNIIVYFMVTPLGFLMFILSLFKIFTRNARTTKDI